MQIILFSENKFYFFFSKNLREKLKKYSTEY